MKKILIVDSDFTNLKVLGKYFSENAFSVLIAITTEQAIKIAEAKLPDVILTLFNTSSVNGLEIHDTLKNKKQTRSIPVLFVSNKKDKKLLDSVSTNGNTAYVLTPCLPDALLNKAIQLIPKVPADKKGSLSIGSNSIPIIMVVDDIEVNRNLIEDFFENAAIKILKSSGGKDSLKKIKGNRIDLILLDIEMPEMNGWQTIEQYKKMKLDIPVVAMSAHGDNDFEKKCKSQGFKGVISKPISRVKLTSLINSILKSTSLTASKEKISTPAKTKNESNTGCIDISKLLSVSKNDADLKISTYKKFFGNINKLQKLLTEKKKNQVREDLLKRELHTFVNLSIYFCKNNIVKKAKEIEFQLKSNPKNFNKNKGDFITLVDDIKNQMKDVKFE